MESDSTSLAQCRSCPPVPFRPVKRYTLDHVYGIGSSNEQVYAGEVKQRLHDVMEGYNLTVFAYGASGGGKTHLMMVRGQGGVGECAG